MWLVWVGWLRLVEGGDREWELKGSIKPQDTSLNFLPHNDYTDKGCNKRRIFFPKNFLIPKLTVNLPSNFWFRCQNMFYKRENLQIQETLERENSLGGWGEVSYFPKKVSE